MENQEDQKHPSDICQATFLTLSRAIVIMYIAGGIAISGIGIAVSYALTTTSDISTLKEQSAQNACRIDKLETQINQKLDIIIRQKELNKP
jgi:hypothetical protein